MTMLIENRTPPRSSLLPSPVVIRPLLPTDAGLLYAMHLRSSPESIYYRYLQYRRPTLDELAKVCQLAPHRGAGLVATLPEADVIVGLAYYVRESHGSEPTAEPGILVEDRFQGQGIGRKLWQQLQQQAQQSGIRWLRVLADPNNHRLARLVQGSDWPYAAKFSRDLNEYLVALNPPPALRLWSASAGRPQPPGIEPVIRPLGGQLAHNANEQRRRDHEPIRQITSRQLVQ